MSRALIAHQVPRTPKRFARTFDQRNSHCRSSTVQIVPIAMKQRVHLADRIVGWGCAFGAIALIAFASLGWLS